MSSSLKQCVEQITDLPTVPFIAQKILEVAGNDMVSTGDIVDIIENDPAISAKVISVANSPFFRIKEPCISLNHAISRIGMDNVKNIAVGVSMLTVLDRGKTSRTLDYQRIFNHSISTGFIAKLFCRQFKLKLKSDVMLSGMLHDLGFMVLNGYFHDRYIDVLKKVKEGMPLLEAEASALGFNHTDIGAWLAEKWKLPESIADSILYHHTPSLAKRNRKSLAVTHIADYITTTDILSPLTFDPEYPFDVTTLEILGITAEEFMNFQKDAFLDLHQEG